LIVVTSGQYIDEEMASELGRIPPSFLPVGNRRLYEHQISLFENRCDKLILTLPDGFILPGYDADWLLKANVNTKFVSQTFSLGESLYHSLKNEMNDMESLAIIFGDTLFSSIDFSENTFSVGYQEEYYPWGIVIKEQKGLRFTDGINDVGKSTGVLSGFFSLSHGKDFLDILEEVEFTFFDALTEYSHRFGLKEIIQPGWLDFGHLHTYFHSKAKRTTERSFNSLEIIDRQVVKKSTKNQKVMAEADWFEALPGKLRLNCPIYLGRENANNEVSYSTEYLYLSTLSELFVHGKLPSKVWEKIFNSCNEYIGFASKIKPKENISSDVASLLISKNMNRLADLDLGDKIDLNKKIILNLKVLPSVNDLVDELMSKIEINEKYFGCMHGDFCFSNIMYDFRVSAIKVIDPRGTLNGIDSSIYGDIRYDLAKFFHSIVGYYDLIIANRYEFKINSINRFDFKIFVEDDQTEITQLFLSSKLAKRFDIDQVLAIMIMLFVSMIPLHTEDPDRQLALLLNAYRLYSDYMGEVT
jgi:hypothetical protein